MATDRGGFLVVPRAFFSGEEWREKRVYSRAEAWLDLYQMAAHTDHERTIGRRSYELRRGQLIASDRYLERRWAWSRNRVRRFLRHHLRNHLAPVNETSDGTIYAIVNYELMATGGTTSGTTSTTSTAPPTEPKRSKDIRKKEVSKKEDREDTSKPSELWKVWIDELGGSGRQPELSDQRSKLLQRLYDEQLVGEPDPLATFRAICQAVKRSDHHMSKRAYHMVESLFRNPERRERWTLDALEGPSSRPRPAGDRSRHRTTAQQTYTPTESADDIRWQDEPSKPPRRRGSVPGQGDPSRRSGWVYE